MTKKLTDYELLKDIYDVVGRLEKKMDDRLNCVEAEVSNRTSAVEIRTTALELWKSNMMGKISIIAALAGSAMGIIVSLITAWLEKKI